jgi:hypothetical protein
VHCNTYLDVDRWHDIGGGILMAEVSRYFGLLDSVTDPAWLAQIEIGPTPGYEERQACGEPGGSVHAHT